MSFKVAITGPESTAKSTLAIQLSRYYKCTLIVEYSRDYLHRFGSSYQATDIPLMAWEHNKKLMENVLNSTLQIWDTDLLTYYIWHKTKFKSNPEDLLNLWRANTADYYLISMPDTPWIADPLRENPEDRENLFGMYLQEINKLNLNYNIINGLGIQRFNRCIWNIESQLMKKM